jgi:hypothetical protein
LSKTKIFLNAEYLNAAQLTRSYYHVYIFIERARERTREREREKGRER